MSEQSDRLITEAAKAEHGRLELAVVRTACCWRVAPPELMEKFTNDLRDAVDCLRSFEERHKDRLNGKA